MKKFLQIIFFIISIHYSMHLQTADLPVQYWNSNVNRPKSSLKKIVPLKTLCAQTVAMIKERKTVNPEKSIPLLMELYTKEIHSQPNVILTDEEHIKKIENIQNAFNYITQPLNSGPIYKIFKSSIDKKPQLEKKGVSLRQTYGLISDILIYFNLFPAALSTLNEVIISPNVYNFDDGTKLHIINHELQHQLNGLNHNRTNIALLNNKCFLADLKQTPYLRSVLKPNIKNSKGQNLQKMLEENITDLFKHIRRYEEFRADTRSLESIDCPYCVQEASMHGVRKNGIGYRPDGYINQWQFQPRIEKLKKQGTICQHHHENGKKIDLSICDGSTIEKRMIILQKNS